MRTAFRHMDLGTQIVILLTLTLFIVALFVKGFGHGLLLEAGVFLISVKVVMLAYHNQVNTERLDRKLDQIQALLRTAVPASEAKGPQTPQTSQELQQR